MQPSGVERRDHEQREKQCADADSGDAGHVVVERHTVTGHIPPPVGGGEAQGQQEQHRCHDRHPVAGPPQDRPGHQYGCQSRHRGTHGGEQAEVVDPLGWSEHQREHRREDDAHQSPRGTACHSGNPLAAQHDEHRDEERQRGDQEAEPARQRPVDGGQNQVVVAQVFGVPRLARADVGANAGRLQHGRQSLIGEHHGQHDRADGQ